MPPTFRTYSSPMVKLLCTHDLTPASDVALCYAVKLAERMDATLDVLHVIPGRLDREGRQAAEARMEAAIHTSKAEGRATALIQEGRAIDTIAETSRNGYLLAVIATHGAKGIRQNLFGADILKLVRALGIPAIVVQENTVVQDTFDRIVMPVAGHANIDNMLDLVCHLALLHAAEVQVYQLLRPGDSPSEQLLRNKQAMLERLRADGIRHMEVCEPSTVFSIGFAAATAEYAHRNGADCLAIMAGSSSEYRHISDAEKEYMLTNPYGIPVLCA